MSANTAPAYDYSESFGRRLRRERERRQIALSSIAENSKISASLLRGLERDDVSKWPPGIFRRSFMRAYAEAVGLDVEETIREFLDRFPDPDPDRLNPPAPHAPPALRLTFANTDGWFSRGRILATVRTRLLALAFDATLIVMLGLAIGFVVNALWMLLCPVAITYSAAGILILGNTLGVRLCAPRRYPAASSATAGTWRIFSPASGAARDEGHTAAAGDRELAHVSRLDLAPTE